MSTQEEKYEDMIRTSGTNLSYECNKCGERTRVPARRTSPNYYMLPKYGFKTQYNRRLCRSCYKGGKS